MSIRTLSRGTEVRPFPITTMAELRDAVSVDPKLDRRQKEARRSAIKKACSWIGRQPELISAEFIVVMRELEALNGASAGVTQSRFENVRSLVRRTLLSLREDLVDTRKQHLSPEWRALFAVTGSPHVQRTLGRFARWCSARSVVPSDVTQKVVADYEAYLKSVVAPSRVRAGFVTVCRVWNQYGAAHPGIWPQVSLDAGDRRKTYVLSQHAINPLFDAEVENMLQRFSSRIDLIDGFSKPFAPATVAEMRRVFRRLYTVAVKERPIHSLVSIAQLVEAGVVRTILEFYLTRFGKENTRSAAKYLHFLLVAAKYWVKAGPEQVGELAKFRLRLKPKVREMAASKRAMLRMFEDPERCDLLLGLGEKAAAAFKAIKTPTKSDALKLQSAMAISLLTAAPVRPANLCSIALDRHLVRGREGKRTTLRLVFPANEVKNDQSLEFKLPGWVVEIVELYLARAAPLIDPGSRFLFPGAKGEHKGSQTLSQQITTTTWKSLGVRVTGHAFRALVGFLYLQENPGGHEVVRRFLGHKRIETTVQFYAGMEQSRAIELLDRHLESRRKHSSRTAPAGTEKALSGKRPAAEPHRVCGPAMPRSRAKWQVKATSKTRTPGRSPTAPCGGRPFRPRRSLTTGGTR